MKKDPIILLHDLMRSESQLSDGEFAKALSERNGATLH